MVYNVLRKISFVILGVALLNLFAYAVVYVHEGGENLGFLTHPLKEFSEFPKVIFEVAQEVEKPEYSIVADSNFLSENKMSYDLYGMNGRVEKGNWLISLKNLRNDSIIHEWNLLEKDFHKTDREFTHSEPRGPILLADKSVIVTCDESKNMFRIDKDSKVIWHNTDQQYHHAINLSADSNIWASSRMKLSNKKNRLSYWDNSICKIDLKTGETLYKKSMTKVFHENNLEYMLFGKSNRIHDSGEDPMHLNDVEPILEDGKYWKKGDVLLSFRHISAVLLFRPSTGKVIRVIQGSFYGQHDVDILNDSTITVFNNNISTIKKGTWGIDTSFVAVNETFNRISGVVAYHFNDSTFTTLLSDQFEEEKVYTFTQGLHHVLSNGDVFVESQNNGKIYVLSKEGTLLKKYYNDLEDIYVQRPHWTRTYEDINFLNQ
ncbi:MAG: hypothetical protein CL843_04950 [Crocinitomicaceae bacterium]|nr:hypothetical protein [Crocinitomicaceae bacterium]|tara:strand:- start:1741 stop:3036 length:1296 start_codon:yes stop_codon:yes gene_type:complete